MRIRSIFALLSLPLMAFTCFPSPSSTLLIRPSAESTSVGMFPDSADGRLVLRQLREFSKRFALTEHDCRGSWPSWNSDFPCFAFTRFKDEGIGIYLATTTKGDNWQVFLVKEGRVFGAHPTSDVKKQFELLVKQPIIDALGESHVQAE